MPLFEVTIKSVFENIFLIEADSQEQASTKAFTEDRHDFYQKHSDETISSCVEVSNDIATQRKSIIERGYR